MRTPPKSNTALSRQLLETSIINNENPELKHKEKTGITNNKVSYILLYIGIHGVTLSHPVNLLRQIKYCIYYFSDDGL